MRGSVLQLRIICARFFHTYYCSTIIVCRCRVMANNQSLKIRLGGFNSGTVGFAMRTLLADKSALAVETYYIKDKLQIN